MVYEAKKKKKIVPVIDVLNYLQRLLLSMRRM